MVTLQEKETTSLVETAYREIKRKILDDEYPPGLQALEQEVAGELGMSRTPVREALIRLESDGLVELVPRRGMRVVPLSIADLEEIYQLLTGLETMAAELLARKKPSSEELLSMEQAVAEMDQALERDDLDGWAAADERYHRTLLDLCGNRRLAALAYTVWDQAHRARMVTLKLRPKPFQSAAEHRAVLESIRKGDWETAREAHYQHRIHAGQVITRVLREYRLARA